MNRRMACLGSSLTGNIPSELGNLAELQFLSLAINDMTDQSHRSWDS